MASAWLTGIFGAIGAMLGAVATLVGTWLPTRAQRRLAADNRKERVADVRRAASAEYLMTVDSFIDSAREVVYQIENKVPEQDREAARKAYLGEWQQMQRTCAIVVISGPDDLGAKAEELKLILGTLANICDRWSEAVKHGPARSQVGKFDNAWESAEKVRTEFASIAREYAYERAEADR
jgi:hypothetical protein